jgi:hypothetical protein
VRIRRDWRWHRIQLQLDTRALGIIDKRLLGGYKKHATFVKNPERYNAFMLFIWGFEKSFEGVSEWPYGKAPRHS